MQQKVKVLKIDGSEDELEGYISHSWNEEEGSLSIFYSEGILYYSSCDVISVNVIGSKKRERL